MFFTFFIYYSDKFFFDKIKFKSFDKAYGIISVFFLLMNVDVKNFLLYI